MVERPEEIDYDPDDRRPPTGPGILEDEDDIIHEAEADDSLPPGSMPPKESDE